MSAPTASKGAQLRRALPRVMISLLIAGGFAWALERGGLPLKPPSEAFGTLTWWAVPAFCGLMLLSIYFRTTRWVYMLRPLAPNISAWRAAAVCLIGYGALFFAPLRLGEMVRPYLIASGDGELTFAEGLGTVAAERAIDGVVIVLMTATALFLSTPISPLPDHVGKLPVPVSLVPSVLLSAAVLFGVAFAGMALLYVARDHAVSLVRGLVGRFSTKLADRVAGIVERLLQGLSFLTVRGSAFAFLRDTMLYWLLMAAALWALLSGVGLSPSFSQACVTVGIIALGSLLPAGPGFFGAYQVASYTSLAMYYAMPEVTTRGAMFVLASYVSHVGLNLGSCVVGFAMLARTNRNAASVAASR